MAVSIFFNFQSHAIIVLEIKQINKDNGALTFIILSITQQNKTIIILGIVGIQSLPSVNFTKLIFM
jgi:hypothetical protein